MVVVSPRTSEAPKMGSHKLKRHAGVDFVDWPAASVTIVEESETGRAGVPSSVDICKARGLETPWWGW